MSRYLFTSESVSEGHPDKMCDQISDAVLDAALTEDPRSRVACECLCKTGFIAIAGEITTKAKNLDFGRIARNVVKDIGYTDSSMGFDAETCGVLIAVEPQSPDISQGVTEGEGLHKEQGAGDQGLMFGYACDETPELMPAPIMYSHELVQNLAKLRKSNRLDFLRPDSKSQVTIEYENDRPKRIDAVVVSTQHSPDVKHKDLKEAVIELCIKKTIPSNLLDAKTKYFVNPTGRFVIGGPFGDAGLTGRKIIVDTYGGMGRHGGGAFSGKDPSKVDRSACYFARYVAKNIVAAGLARRCEVQVAYAIGVAQPVGVYVSTFGTGAIDDEKIAAYVMKNFDFRPKALIDELDLLRPMYRETAAYGHFGRAQFPWEATTHAEALAQALLRKSALYGQKATKKASTTKPSAKGADKSDKFDNSSAEKATRGGRTKSAPSKAAGKAPAAKTVEKSAPSKAAGKAPVAKTVEKSAPSKAAGKAPVAKIVEKSVAKAPVAKTVEKSTGKAAKKSAKPAKRR